ncbi:MAG: response regulator [Anaerolineae bacterium]
MDIESAQVPDDFVALVRNALMHLYDHAHLQRHPLARLVAGSVAPFEDAARALRHLLLDTLEQLNPGPQISRNDKEWRPYGILVRRYVNGFSIEETIRELHISVRQFHREHQKGLLAAAEVLWRRWVASQESPDSETTGVSVGTLRREMQRLGVNPEQVDLTAILQGVLSLVQGLAREGNVILEATLPDDPVRAWADPTLARQALLGTLSALILVQPRRLQLAWSSTHGHVVLDLCVEPPLLDDDSREAREREEKLAIAEELMTAQGARFLPIMNEGTLTGVRLSFRQEKNRRVLLIDDDVRMMRLFERYLSAEGFAVTGVNEGQAALEAVKRDPPEAIVLDVMMREMDGWQVLQELRANPRLEGVSIIVCSVLNEPELAQILGAQSYLKKPVSQRQLLAALRQALDECSPAGRHLAGR